MFVSWLRACWSSSWFEDIFGDVGVGQLFESWFGASEEYDRLQKLKLLTCQSCESINVEKTLMSPNLLNTKKKRELKWNKKI